MATGIDLARGIDPALANHNHNGWLARIAIIEKNCNTTLCAQNLLISLKNDIESLFKDPF